MTAPRWPHVGRFEAVVAGVPLLVAGAAYLSLRAGGTVQVLPGPMLFLGALLAMFAVIVVVYTRREMRIANMTRITGLGVMLSALYPLPMYWIAAHGGALGDAMLASWDRAIHSPAVALAVLDHGHPALQRATRLVYDSLQAGGIVALLALPLTDRMRRAQEFLGGLFYASLLSLALFWLVQGTGPWAAGAFEPSAVQRQTGDLLTQLQRGAPVTLDLAHPGALIAFPSWHTILAVLTGVALAFRRETKVLATLWSAGVVVSTLLTGWHYGVDVLAGLVVATVAAVAARHTPWEVDPSVSC